MINASFKDSYIGLKLRQLKHKLIYRYRYHRMKSAYTRFKDCNDKKPKKQIREEISICKRFWGCYPLHYFRYDLYKRDKKLTKEELINYVPEFFFYNLFLPHYDGDKYSILLGDKNIAEQLFRSVNIYQPYTICKLINGKIYTSDLEEKSFDEVNLELKERLYNKIFVKPVDGEGGYGIIIFHLSEDNKYINNNNEELSEVFLFNIGVENNYIIQSGVIQDESITKIYSYSVNTFRIATENIKGKVRLICGVLRIGRDGNEVDNASQNGIVLGIDCNTGICKEYAGTEEGEIFYKHPDSNFVFKNHKINKWNSIVDFTIECASKLPQFTYLGWDVALTREGPIAIETNLGFSIDIFQIALGGFRENFNINDPNKHWKK
ncbi:MAG TPA: sugar-transfer associated ATP-grasp domain-containing protein [Clostridium sp.]|uniref:sugar-transfer associated ATP-grasp domain-containing protein n=1 Tax=Clostridium sp. TaxID=1506 RepID=UPI002F9389B5